MRSLVSLFFSFSVKGLFCCFSGVLSWTAGGLLLRYYCSCVSLSFILPLLCEMRWLRKRGQRLSTQMLLKVHWKGSRVVCAIIAKIWNEWDEKWLIDDRWVEHAFAEWSVRCILRQSTFPGCTLTLRAPLVTRGNCFLSLVCLYFACLFQVLHSRERRWPSFQGRAGAGCWSNYHKVSRTESEKVAATLFRCDNVCPLNTCRLWRVK